MLNSSYAILYQEGLLMHSQVKMTAEFKKMGAIVWKWIPKALWRHQLSIWANLGTFLKLSAISNRFMKIIIRWYFKVPSILKNQLFGNNSNFGNLAPLRRRVVHLGPKYPQD